jgi:hypothetical protein
VARYLLLIVDEGIQGIPEPWDRYPLPHLLVQDATLHPRSDSPVVPSPDHLDDPMHPSQPDAIASPDNLQAEPTQDLIDPGDDLLNVIVASDPPTPTEAEQLVDSLHVGEGLTVYHITSEVAQEGRLIEHLLVQDPTPAQGSDQLQG